MNSLPLLGFGAMRLPRDERTCRTMFDLYLESGFNYFDTAYVYENSEDMLRKALVAVHPRNTFLLADKLPTWKARNADQCDKLFHESLKRCSVDYFDYYLIHALDENNAEKATSAGVYEWMAQQKKKGLIRYAGFSFHGSAALLEQVLTAHPEMDFVQLQLNYMDILRGQAGELQKIALVHDIPIIVMEPVKGGTLAQLPPEAETLMKTHRPDRSVASWAIRYAAGLEGVRTVLSGMSTPEQVRDNVASFNPFEPLTPEEHSVLDAVLVELTKVAVIPCTACRYCMADCPQGIEIPVCFSLYNEHKRSGMLWNRKALYDALDRGKRAGDCSQCGTCLSHCPQGIDIPKELTEVAKVFK